MAIIAGVGCLVLFLIFGMPVGFALLGAGALGIVIDQGFSGLLSTLTTTPFRTAASFTLSAVPMFILMAEFISSSGSAEDIYKATYKWLGHLPGGLAIASVLASAGMGAMCGSSTATAAAMSNVAIPEMDRYKYNRQLSSGVVAIAGTLAIMIPPSIPLVIYGIQTETSIGKLLIAGIIPGLLTAFTFSMGIAIWAKIKPEWAPIVKPFSWRERFASLKGVWTLLVLIFLVIGTIYTGMATPTEAAAIGAAGAWVILMFLKRRGMVRNSLKAIGSTVKITSMIFTIIIGAMVFGYFLTMTGAAQAFIGAVSSLPLPNWAIMLIVVSFYLVLGCFMDQIAILLLTLPLTFPLVMNLGYDPIWFGIIVTKLAEIGMVTPPLGMNVYVVSSATKLPLETVFKGVSVMLLIDAVNIALLLLFPKISTWLPSLMK